MATLRQNLLLSAVAMLVVGVLRPAFHGIVNQTFGPEINGRAAAAISLFFLAALPASAALPTVVVRQMSRALGEDDEALARGRAALGTRWVVVLAVLGAAGALIYAHVRFESPPSLRLLITLAVATVTYAVWRLTRNLLLVMGQIRRSLMAEISGAVVLGGVLLWFIQTQVDPEITPLAVFYVVYLALVFGPLTRALKNGRLEDDDRRVFFNYTLLWSIGTATSLATREATLLVLESRVEAHQLGDASVALSLLMLLAFAPRILDVPLTHELSTLGGSQKADAQRQLAEVGMHWLSIVTVALAAYAAFFAGPILKFAGGVEDPAVITVFVFLLFAFATEMMVAPATNLLAAEAEPRALAWPGVVSLIVALGFWFTPYSQGLIGVCLGLALSYAVKAIWIFVYARLHYGVRFVSAPRHAALAVTLLGLGWAIRQGTLTSIVAALVFTAVLLVLFGSSIRAMLQAARPGAAP